ncbi:MAG: hypothetical protein ACE360_06015 [Hyphomicrobiales bacterium]
MTPEVREDIPWADTLTNYDNAHFTIYLQLLNASADHATDDEMARLVLGIDPSQEPERARKTLRSHLDRANWLMTSGYKELFAR